jgi:hypothetical protein
MRSACSDDDRTRTDPGDIQEVHRGRTVHRIPLLEESQEKAPLIFKGIVLAHTYRHVARREPDLDKQVDSSVRAVHHAGEAANDCFYWLTHPKEGSNAAYIGGILSHVSPLFASILDEAWNIQEALYRGNIERMSPGGRAAVKVGMEDRLLAMTTLRPTASSAMRSSGVLKQWGEFSARWCYRSTSHSREPGFMSERLK